MTGESFPSLSLTLTLHLASARTTILIHITRLLSFIHMRLQSFDFSTFPLTRHVMSRLRPDNIQISRALSYNSPTSTESSRRETDADATTWSNSGLKGERVEHTNKGSSSVCVCVSLYLSSCLVHSGQSTTTSREFHVFSSPIHHIPFSNPWVTVVCEQQSLIAP